MTTVIVGGGIAGLTLAAVFDRLGFHDFQLLERAPRFREEGAGVQIASNAMHVMDWLGLREQVLEIGHPNQGNIYRSIDDDSIIKYVVAGAHSMEAFGAPTAQVNREEFALLLESVVPKQNIRYGANVQDIEINDSGSSVLLDNGERIHADNVVGADGIHSRVRNLVFGPISHEQSTAAWRALIPAERAEGIPLAKWAHIWFGTNRSAVAYWVSGGKYLNFVGSVLASESDSRDWRNVGDLSELQRIYKDSSPVIEDIVSRIDKAFVADIYSTEPLDSFVSGNVALVGDAAHPMMPYMAAGAGQAIEDAFALGVNLVQSPNPLSSYDAIRRDRASQAQEASGRMSPLYHTDLGPAPVTGTGFGSALRQQTAKDFRGWLWEYNIVRELQLSQANEGYRIS